MRTPSDGRHRRLIPGAGSALFALLAPLAVAGCGGSGSESTLTVDMPLHLEEHLDDVTIVGSEVPDDVPESIVWSFDEPQPEWTFNRQAESR